MMLSSASVAAQLMMHTARRGASGGGLSKTSGLTSRKQLSVIDFDLASLKFLCRIYASAGKCDLIRQQMEPMAKSLDQLDQIDRKLLRVLQADGSLSHAELAERVGASTASCWRRIRALEVSGVLKSTVRLVDPALVGRDVNVMVQVRCKSHAAAAREAFEGFIRSRPEVMECYSMSGEWDYQMRVAVADIADYRHFLMDDLLAHPNVDTSASSFALEQVKYETAVPV